MKNFSFRLFVLAIIITTLFSSCKESSNQARLAFVSDNIILPDSSTAYFWGDIMNGDSVIFSNYKHLPILKNVTEYKIDTLYVQAYIYGVNDTTEISKYYIIDKVTKEEETGKMSVNAHFGRFSLFPYEEIPFPITFIYSKENCPFIVEYKYIWIVAKKRYADHHAISGMVYHQKTQESKVGSVNLQKSFMYLNRTFMNWKNPKYNTFIFKDTIIPVLNKYDLLKDKELKVENIIELQ